MNQTAAAPTGLAAAREGVAALRARLWLVALLAIAGLLAGFLMASSGGGGEAYRAAIDTEGLAGNPSVMDVGISTPPGPQASDFLTDAVIDRLVHATGGSRDDLIAHLEVSQPTNQSASQPPIQLIAHADTAAGAKVLLGAWLAAIHDSRRQYIDRLLASGERTLVKELDQASHLDKPAQRRQAQLLLARLQVLQGTLQVDYLIDRGPRPVAPVTHSSARSALAGGLVGFVFGVLLVLLIGLLDGRLRTAEGVAAAFGVPILADMRGDGWPSAEHALERLWALGGGDAPLQVLVVPSGSVDRSRADCLAEAVGEGVEVRVTEPIGAPGLLPRLRQSGAWAIAASPGLITRGEVAAMRAELDGIGIESAGLLLV